MAIQSKGLALGQQSAFNEQAGAIDFALPLSKLSYVDGSVNRMGHDGTGAYVPRTIRQKTAQQTVITAEGELFYEHLPFFFSGFAHMFPFDAGGGIYRYNPLGTASDFAPSVYAPAWETMLYWGIITSDAQLSTGNKALLFYNAFVDQFILKGNAASGELGYTLNLQAGPLDVSGEPDISELGIGAAALKMCHPLDLTIATKTAGTTGGDFTSMTELGCNLLNWTMTVKTPAAMRWAANADTVAANLYSYCGIKYIQPSIVFESTFVTETSTYNAIRQRYVDNTPLVMLFKIGPDSGHEFDLWMSGYWTNVPSVHDEDSDEIVMKATFTAESPAIQTTTPHWITARMLTGWEYDFGVA